MTSARIKPRSKSEWIFPAACLLAMGFAGVMTPRELTLAVGSDTVWMLAGIMGVTAALTNTGAGDDFTEFKED